MQKEQARMHPLSLRIADAGLEQAFSEERVRKTLKPVRAAMIPLCVAANIEGKGEMRTFLLLPPAMNINVSTAGAA